MPSPHEEPDDVLFWSQVREAQKRCRMHIASRSWDNHRGASIRWCPASPGVVAGYCVRDPHIAEKANLRAS